MPVINAFIFGTRPSNFIIWDNENENFSSLQPQQNNVLSETWAAWETMRKGHIIQLKH